MRSGPKLLPTVRQAAPGTLPAMPEPPAFPPTIRTDADRRAFEAGRRAGLAVAAILRQRAALSERVETSGDEPGEQA
jgi:hypothetical protein